MSFSCIHSYFFYKKSENILVFTFILMYILEKNSHTHDAGLIWVQPAPSHSIDTPNPTTSLDGYCRARPAPLHPYWPLRTHTRRHTPSCTRAVLRFITIQFQCVQAVLCLHSFCSFISSPSSHRLVLPAGNDNSVICRSDESQL